MRKGDYQKLICLAAAILLAFIFMPASAHAVKPSFIYVPDDFPSIQSAIGHAKEGMTIYVSPGVYYEQVNYYGKGLQIKSTDGPDHTTIDAMGTGSVVTFTSGETAQSVLEGFTITGGNSWDGGGVYISGSSPIIRDCIITGNTAQRGGGMYISWEAMPVIENSTISLNTALDKGGGVAVAKAYPDFSATVITGNTAQHGAGICAHSTAITYFSDSNISGNSAAFDGGGIHTCWNSWVYLFRSTVDENTAGSSGGGAFVGQYGSLRAWNSLFLSNTAFTGGGIGVMSYDSTLYLNSCTITLNTGTGGGLYGSGQSILTAMNSIIYGNTSAPVTGTSTTITYSDIEVGMSGMGNISLDPLFVSPSGGDFRLGDGSPCIDAGTAQYAPNHDIDGTPRPLGTGYDMGAFEYITAGSNTDSDGDGYGALDECDDDDPAVYPGAPEVKHDGVDQDCNGYDLTIDITRATYAENKDSLRIDATSALGDGAALEVTELGPMSWKASKQVWVLSLEPAGGPFTELHVCGIEGCVTVTLP